MNDLIKQAAQAFWQNDLAKFNPKRKKAPYEFERMFEGGVMYAIEQIKQQSLVVRLDGAVVANAVQDLLNRQETKEAKQKRKTK